jgi:exopolyphosphatase/guanosine-5'-triphosphate,3'-diphosphate pyrophosphatase
VPKRPNTVAAVDLGSNSFHMILARVRPQGLEILDRNKEMVRLGGGLDENGHINPETSARALACLRRFGEHLRGLPPEAVRVVGTNTLRRARASGDFLDAAAEALGHPVEVIAGPEEARLIYLGVAHDINEDGRRLVVDIGGGSTECIVGEVFEPLEAHSLYMGCVGWTRRFFGGGQISARRMFTAELAAEAELEPIARTYRTLGWDRAIGASGTITAVEKVLVTQGWAQTGISAAGIQRLRDRLVELGHSECLAELGISEERRPVFVGGVAVLSGVFAALKIEHMAVSRGALKEGVLYDLLGRIRRDDIREHTVRALGARFAVDRKQAARVERTALHLLGQLPDDWAGDRTEATRLLKWSARLHELGLTLSWRRHQKHGAYLLEHADLPGFSLHGQRILATMVGGHRRTVNPESFAALGSRSAGSVLRLCLLLRLAVVLNRARSGRRIAPVELAARGTSLVMQFPQGWLRDHPLTAFDLDQEAHQLGRIGWELTVQELQ